MHMRYLSLVAGIGLWIGAPIAALAQAVPHKFNPETGLYEYTTVQTPEEESQGYAPATADTEEIPTQETIQVDHKGRQVELAAPSYDGSGENEGIMRYRDERGLQRGGASGANREAYEAMMDGVTPGGVTNPQDDVKGRATRSELNQYSNGRDSRRSQSYRDRNGYDDEYRDMERRDHNGQSYTRSNGSRGSYNVQRYSRSAYREGGNEDYLGRYVDERYYDGRRSSNLGEKGSNKDAYNEMMSQIEGK